jgi:hypothetical protein
VQALQRGAELLKQLAHVRLWPEEAPEGYRKHCRAVYQLARLFGTRTQLLLHA